MTMAGPNPTRFRVLLHGAQALDSYHQTTPFNQDFILVPACSLACCLAALHVHSFCAKDSALVTPHMHLFCLELGQSENTLTAENTLLHRLTTVNARQPRLQRLDNSIVC